MSTGIGPAKIRSENLLLAPGRRDYSLLWFGLTVSGLGNGFRTVSVAFVVLAVGGGVIDVGLVLAASAIPSVALALFGGVLVDRLAGRRFLLISDAGRAICLALLAGLLAAELATVVIVLAINILYGIFDSVFQPAFNTVLPQTVDESDLQRANAFVQFGTTTTYLIGLGVGGLVITWLGVQVAVAIDAATFLASFIFILAVRSGRARPEAVAANFWQDIREGWRAIVERKWLLAELLRSTVEFPLSVAPFFILGPIIAESELGGSFSWAVILAAFTLGNLGGAWIAARYKPSRPMLICTALMMVGAASPLLLAFSDSTVLIALSEGVKGVAVGFFSAIWATLLQRKIPSALRGRVGAWDFALSTGLNPIGFIIAGPLSVAFGATSVLVLASLVVVVGVSIQLMVPSVRKLTW